MLVVANATCPDGGYPERAEPGSELAIQAVINQPNFTFRANTRR